MVATLEFVNMAYNIVDNMEKMKTDISVFEISKLNLQQKLLMKARKVRDEKTSNANDKGKEIVHLFDI